MNGHNRRHQADKLMELFQEVANHQPDDKEPMEDEEMKRDEYVELDVLNLPPRREVHGNKKREIFIQPRPAIRPSVCRHRFCHRHFMSGLLL